MQIFLIIYTVLLINAYKSENDLYFLAVIIFGILSVVTIKVYSLLKVKNTKKKVQCIIAGNKENHTPFINVNRENWKVLQEIPNFTTVQAKKIVWIRNHNGLYTSIEDFFTKNDVADENKELLKKIIKI